MDMAPIAQELSPWVLADDVASLPESSLILRQNNVSIFTVTSAQAPRLLLEIGRLRELTFRMAGEGTGRSRDIDRFDATYQHLVAWDHAERAILGSYRYARMDHLAATGGPAALYCQQLFGFGEGFISSLGPALELGRAFVRREHQRSGVLRLLWKAIGGVMSELEGCRYLVGAVSIDRGYPDEAIDQMVAYLQRHHECTRLAPLVSPARPWHLPEPKTAMADLPASVAGLTAQLKATTPGGRGIPVLLKHYLLLGAEVVAFNTDPEFGDVVDCLVCIDFERIPERKRQRYRPAA